MEPLLVVAYPAIDPVLVQIGPLAIRWYALAYIGGIAAGWWYLSRLIARPALFGGAGAPLTRLQLDDAITWIVLGVILGGRLGYVFFYEPALLAQPWEPLGAAWAPGPLKTVIGWLPIPPALMLWKGGMSFHGGLIGVTLAGVWFARRNRLEPLRLGDLFAAATPIGLFFGRIANFINAELYGRPWTGPWAMVFPTDPQGVPRHPSQLYEAVLEGVVLFAVLFVATRRFGLLARPGATIGLFLAGYAMSRILVENFREPDAHMPDFPLGLTMGMMLSVPMLMLGAWLLLRRPRTAGA